MSNPWNHLPNAKYIDAILASVKAYPKEWDAARDATRNATRSTARRAAWDATRNAIRNTAKVAMWDPISNALYGAGGAAWHAIRALVVWDDCAYMLESDPDELEIIAVLGCPKATLLLYACKALAAIKEKEKENV